MPGKSLVLAAALSSLLALPAMAQEGKAPEVRTGVPVPQDHDYEIGIHRGAADLPAELVLERRVVTRSGRYLGDVKEVTSFGGEPAARLERDFLFGLFADEKTVPLSLLQPFGRDRLLVMTSRRDLRRHPAFSD